MLFWKRHRRSVGESEAAGNGVASGYEAIRAQEVLCGTALAQTRWSTDESEAAHAVGREREAVRSMGTAASLGGYLMGAAAAGVRVAGITHDDELPALRDLLADASAKGAPFVLHHACYDRGAESRTNGHESVRSVLNTGAVVLFASGLQQALDLGLIGRRIAEESLLPVIVAQDAFDPQRTLESLQLADADLVHAYLGEASEVIPSLTPSQEIVHGAQRRRVPRLVNVERPVAIGAPLEPNARRKSAAARSIFVYGHVAAISNRAMEGFAAVSGRAYGAIEAYRVEDADFLVVAQGVVAERLRLIADHFRKSRKTRVGVVQIVRVRPFPAAPLSHLLKGKKAVTVLDSVGRTYMDTGPLSEVVRDTIEKSIDQNRLPEISASPEYAAYRDGEAPVQYRATTLDTVPADTALVALVENMIAGGQKSARLGPSFEAPAVRLPPLERLAQRIRSSYPDADAGISVAGDTPSFGDRESVTIEISGSPSEVGEASRIIAEGVFSTFGWPVRSGPVFGRGFASSLFATSYRPSANSSLDQPGPTDVLVLTLDRLARHPSLPERLRTGGALIVATAQDALSLWRKFPRSVREIIRGRDLQLFIVTDDASETESDPLAQTMLLAGAAIALQFNRAADRQLLLDGCAASLERRGSPTWIKAACVDAMLRGADNVVQVNWQEYASAPETRNTERMAPWTARTATTGDESIFDAGRFWQSVGHLYETGQAEATLVDPYVASGVVPGRTSAFRQWSEATHSIASFIPEACTGCGACWSLCPDAALPAAIHDVGALVEQCFQDLASRSVALTQLDRIKPHLVKQAHQLAAGDERNEYRSLDVLLANAFEKILERLKADESQEQLLRGEFDALRKATNALPVARTEVFFTAPDTKDKGSGLLLTVSVNADACKGCGLCVEACPEKAMEMVERSQALVESLRDQWRFAQSLPVVQHDRIEEFVSDENDDTQAYRLLDRRSYHATVGGDDGAPGDGLRATVRLVSSFIDAVVRPRLDAFAHRVDEMIRRLEQQTDEVVHQSLEIGDFEEFRKRLDELGDQPIDAARLAQIASGREADIDTPRLRLLADTLHDLRRVHERLEARRSSGATMAAVVSSASVSAGASYPYNPFAFPWIRADSVDAVAMAEGMFNALVDQSMDDFRSVRKSELVLQRLYDPTEHDGPLKSLSWHDLTEEEWALCPPVCVLAEQAEDVLPRIMMTDAPLNVFILERSIDSIHGATPAMWPLARPDLYVHHGSAGHVGPMLRGVARGLSWRGPALHRLYVCDPERDGVPADKAAQRMRLAVDSRAFPLLRYDPAVAGEWIERWTLDGNPHRDGDWISRASVDGDAREELSVFTLADWAVSERRFRNFFEPVPRHRWTPEMMPLGEYLDLKESERALYDPFVTTETQSGHRIRLRVDPAMVVASETALERWRMIQELAGVRSAAVDAVQRSVRQESERTLEKMRKEIAADLEAEYKRRQDVTAGDYHARLTEKLLVLSGYAPGDRQAEQKLREVLSRAAGYASKSEDAENAVGPNGDTIAGES